MVALIVDGMLDGDNYSSQLVFLTFVPIGTAWGLFFACFARPITHHLMRSEFVDRQSSARYPSGSVAIAFVPFLLVAAMVLTPGGLAVVYANAGAVAQTKAELSIYDWPRWTMQDDVRRMNPERLISAKRFYDIALSFNPYNVTAQWRLGQLALAQGDYFIAEQHLAQAYAVSPQHRAVRQLLGEIYAIQGKKEEAIQLWKPLDVGQNQLQLRQWWYEMIGDSDRAQNFQETVRLYEQSACCQ
jgi:tetratricopeptide (TPR) repeat protein